MVGFDQKIQFTKTWMCIVIACSAVVGMLLLVNNPTGKDIWTLVHPTAGILPTNMTARRLAVNYNMVESGNSPYKMGDRSDLSVRVNSNCMGVLIASEWVLTAKHCVKSGKNYIKINGKQTGVKSTIKHAKDIVLFKLKAKVGSHRRMPVLLINAKFHQAAGKENVKKDSGYHGEWRNIPASGRGDNWFISKGDRKGGAGTSGSPLVIHSDSVGDVLVGITHGSGRAVQIGHVAAWIEQKTGGSVVWATKHQTLN